MTANSQLVVWEWEDERLSWRPYEPHVSNFIEQNRTSGAPLNLGPADIKMKHYSIDFIRMTQIRINTGTCRKVARHLYPEDSAIGGGVIWQYEGDIPGMWQPYASSFVDVLEPAYHNGEHKLDLRKPPLYMPYKIDLKKMVQIRVETKRQRKIERITNPNPVPYLRDSGGGKTPSAGAIFGASSASGAVGGVGSTFGTSTFSHNPHGVGHTSYLPNGLYALGNKASAAISSMFGSPPATASTSTGAVTRGKVTKSQRSSVKSSGSAASAVASSTKSDGGGARKKTITRLPPYGSFTNKADPKTKKKKVKASEFDQIINPVMKVLKDPPKDEDCCLCMSGIHENSGLVDEKKSVPIKLKCGHMFHKSCLKAMYDSGAKDECIQCPTCKAIYGVKCGICPAGTMTYDTLSTSLPGHSDCDTIRVMYDIKPGTQGPEHPHPGQRYSTQGFPRIGFLPNNDEGQKVLKLLIKAWERRLTFTIGQSATTGAQNMVVWNGIHHKTEMVDHSGHGYPAPNYLDNVKLECAALGVVASDDEDDGNEEVAMDTQSISDSEDSDL